jgi:hypothetical protein
VFCPECQSEYRAAIRRCADCDVDLVDALGASPEIEEAPGTRRPSGTDAMVDYCGFVSLDEARQARETLRRDGIPSEITIRDAAPGARGAGPPREEYWLRVPVSRYENAADLLGYDEAPEARSAAEGDTVACSECGRQVAEDESFCPHCGARFED